MDEEEKRVDAPAEQPTQDSISSAPTISRRRGKGNRRRLTMRSNVRTLSIKIYTEQAPMGIHALIHAIVTADPKKMQIIAMKHDRDTMADDFYCPAVEKEHYHILVRVLEDKPKHLSTILNMLGVVFRC